MPNPIPDKGKILTALSLFWFEKFGRQFENHLLASRVADYPAEVRRFVDQIEGRSMLVRKAKVVPIECVARGYLAGSGWKEYQKSQTVCGIKLPAGLKQCDKLPEAIFTPSTKEETGHDINIDYDETSRRVGEDIARQLRTQTLALYTQAADYAASRGVIIADTKFGVRPGRRWKADPHRRGAHPRLQPFLARRPIPARPRPAQLRQAVRAELSRSPAVEQDPPGSRAAPRCGRGNPQTLPRSLRAAHGQAVEAVGAASAKSVALSRPPRQRA